MPLFFRSRNWSSVFWVRSKRRQGGAISTHPRVFRWAAFQHPLDTTVHTAKKKQNGTKARAADLRAQQQPYFSQQRYSSTRMWTAPSISTRVSERPLGLLARGQLFLSSVAKVRVLLWVPPCERHTRELGRWIPRAETWVHRQHDALAPTNLNPW